MGNGPSRLDLIFLLYIVLRLWALSQTFFPRVKGLKSDLMWLYMCSRAILCAVRASLRISSRSRKCRWSISKHNFEGGVRAIGVSAAIVNEFEDWKMCGPISQIQ